MALGILCLLAFPCLTARAVEPTRSFDVPAGEAAQTLKQFAAQAGREIVYADDAVGRVKTNAVQGELTPKEAIDRLLADTGLTATEDAKTGAWAVRKTASNPDGKKARAGGPVTASGHPDPTASDNSRAVVAMEKYTVASKQPYTAGNMDIVRTIDDAQPYYIFNNQAIDQSDALNVEDFLKDNLVMNTNAVSYTQIPTEYRGAPSTISLRGLGPLNTLILIDGRRTASVAALGTNNQPDLNDIPPTAIERIEVLPSSSAGIYGGSAVGGVINVVLKKNYNGGEAVASYENSEASNSAIRTVDGTYGISLNGGKTQVMISAHYSGGETLVEGDRENLYNRGLTQILAHNRAYLLNPTTPFAGGSTPNIASATGANLTLKAAYGGAALNSPITNIPAGTSPTTASATLAAGLLANAGSYNFTDPAAFGQNFGRFKELEAAPTDNSFLINLRQRLTDKLVVFGSFFNSNDRIDTAIGIWDSLSFAVPASSPSNPFNQAVNVSIPDQGVPYITNKVTQTVTGGLLLDLPHDWQAEADYTWSYSLEHYNAPAGIITAGSQTNAGLASGAINPFVDTLAYPLPTAPYTFGAGSQGNPSILKDVPLRLAGPLWSLPAGSPTVAIGLEYRAENLETGTFYNYASTGTFRLYPPESQSTDSVYVEAKVPLVSAANAIPGVRLLDLQLSGRSESFTVDATNQTFITENAVNFPLLTTTTRYTSTNPTVGLRYAPVDGVTLRASYGTAFLPPTYSQLSSPTMGSAVNPAATVAVIDPKRGNLTEQVEYYSGGNPNLKPQTSKDWNMGIVYAPTFLKGFRLDLEWYHIALSNVAIVPTVQQIVTNEALFPSRVVRGPLTAADQALGYTGGLITSVDYSVLSSNQEITEGADLSIGYVLRTENFGSFDFRASGTRISEFEQQLAPGAPLVNIDNQVAYGGPVMYKENGDLTWKFRNWSLGWTVIHYGSYLQDNVGGLTSYVAAQGSTSVASQTYHNVFASYTFPGPHSTGTSGGPAWYDRALADVTIRAGVKNVFGTLPPFDAYYGNYAVGPTVWTSPFGDARLRSFWVSLEKLF